MPNHWVHGMTLQSSRHHTESPFPSRRILDLLDICILQLQAQRFNVRFQVLYLPTDNMREHVRLLLHDPRHGHTGWQR
jgi:hypothetical protein